MWKAAFIYDGRLVIHDKDAAGNALDFRCIYENIRPFKRRGIRLLGVYVNKEHNYGATRRDSYRPLAG